MKCMKAKKNGMGNSNLNILFLPIKLLCRKYSSYLILFLLVGIVYSTLNTGIILAKSMFVDEAANLLKTVMAQKRILLLAAFLGFVSAFEIICNGVYNFMYLSLSLKMQGEIQKTIFEKINRLSPLDFETSENLERIKKAKEGGNGIFIMWLTAFSIISFYMPYFIMIEIYLYRMQPVLSIFLLFIFFPVFLSQIINHTLVYNYIDTSTPYKRKYEYFNCCITEKKFFKETRFWGAVPFFREKFIANLKGYSEETWKINKKSTLIHLCMESLTIVGYFSILYLLFRLLVNNTITIGVFVAVFTSIKRMYNLMNEMIVRHVGGILRNYGSVKKYCIFMKMPEYHETAVSMDGGITLSHVDFTYPEGKKEVFRDFNLRIKKNETVAVIGANGSGKSTLAKLLASMYKAESGEIKTLGKGRTSMVFQNFQKYDMSLKDNIKISALNRKESDTGQISLMDSLKMAGLSNRYLLDNLETEIGRKFGGIDLSGGEWQRVAIARGIYRKHDLLILDEPTAAINPLEENRIFCLFEELSKDCTTILITHRMGAVKIADRIIVLENGSIIEDGTYGELLESKGKFAEMISMQAELYE